MSGHLKKDKVLAILFNVINLATKNIQTKSKHKIKINFKTDRSLVTNIDVSTNKIIVNNIKKYLIDVDCISEEGVYPKNLISKYIAIIDPLDGTTNFTRKIPYYAVSIALYDNQELKYGIVKNVTTNDTYFAVKGRGAWKIDGRANVLQRLKRINVEMQLAILALGCDMNDSSSIKLWKKWLQQLYPPKVRRIRINESASLELCYVAENKFDGYIHPTDKPWDMAAGGLIVKEAGGIVLGSKGGLWDPLSRGIIAIDGGIETDIRKISRRLQ